MKISIAMATYNGAKYIQRQLDSFVSQTKMPDEVVVSDDQSSDDTIGILEQFQKDAPFVVRIYQNEVNLGYTKNFEKALTKCTGDLIFLSDQDDVWFQEKIAVVTETFFANPEKLLVIHDGKLVDEQLVWHGSSKLKQVTSAYGSPDSALTGALTAVHRVLLDLALPIPEGLKGHDVWLHNIASLLDARCVLENELQLIVRHESNTSTWVGSSIKKINKFDLWKSEFQTKATTSYQDRMLINKASQARLKKINIEKFGHLREILSVSMIRLFRERKALHFREALVNKPWFLQKLMSVYMLAKGDYQYFNGMKSFLRDLMR